MKIERPQRSLGKQTPPAGGLQKMLTNATSLAGVKGKLKANCEICGTEFMRHYTLLARSAHHYCSKVCAGFACRRRVDGRCGLCGAPVILNPHRAQENVCCGAECMDLSRRLRRSNEANGRYERAVVMRSAGATLQEIAHALGQESRQAAAHVLAKAAERTLLLARIQERKAMAMEASPVLRHVQGESR